jgi:uroporphyrinogen III methyltransferase/synthase
VRVLITRSARDGDPLRRCLEDLGAEVSHLPTIAVEPPESWAPLDDALRQIAGYHYVVFTSRNAVEAVFARLPLVGFPKGIPKGPEVVAAGDVTARLLHNLGVDTIMRPARDQKVQGVAAVMLTDDLHGRRVLYPTSDLARPALKQQLEAAGARVDQIVAYRTVRPQHTDPAVVDALREGGFDVLIASPSAVQNLKAILEPDWSCLRLAHLVCIGYTTARTARDEGLEPMAVAREPSVSGLAEAILSLYDTEGIHDG